MFKEKINLSNITFSYTDKIVLDNISLEASIGDVICIEGENGSGKTTLLKVISGILLPDKFDVFLDGKKMNKNNLKDDIIFIPSEINFYENLSSKENIDIIKYLWKQDDEYWQRVKLYLREFALIDRLDDIVNTFSLGMRYKLFLSAFLAIKRKILLLDEPLNAMDSESKCKAIKYIQEYSCNSVVIFSSHTKDIVNKLSTKKYLLSSGKIEGKS